MTRIRSFKGIGLPLLAASVLSMSAAMVNPASAQPSVERTAKVGRGLYELVFNPVDQLVYVSSTGEFIEHENGEIEVRGASIIALDSRTLDVRRAIDTGDRAPYGLALNTRTQKLYATDPVTASISVFDARTGERLAAIKNGDSTAGLRQIVIDEATNTIYAGAMGGFSKGDEPAPPSAVWIIDGATDTLRGTIDDPLPSITGLAHDAAANRLYVSDIVTSEVAVIDLATRRVLRTFPGGGGGASDGPPDAAAEADGKPVSDTINLVLHPSGQRLFAINQASGTVTVLDPADGRLLHTIATGRGALSARFNARTNQLYVANRGDGTVSVIDADTYFVTAHLPSGTHPQTIAIDPATGAVYVSNKAKGKDWKAPKDAPEPFEPGGDTVTLIRP